MSPSDTNKNLLFFPKHLKRKISKITSAFRILVL